jgi:hypothetical protein
MYTFGFSLFHSLMLPLGSCLCWPFNGYDGYPDIGMYIEVGHDGSLQDEIILCSIGNSRYMFKVW